MLFLVSFFQFENRNCPTSAFVLFYKVFAVPLMLHLFYTEKSIFLINPNGFWFVRPVAPHPLLYFLCLQVMIMFANWIEKQVEICFHIQLIINWTYLAIDCGLIRRPPKGIPKNLLYYSYFYWVPSFFSLSIYNPFTHINTHRNHVMNIFNFELIELYLYLKCCNNRNSSIGSFYWNPIKLCDCTNIFSPVWIY